MYPDGAGRFPCATYVRRQGFAGTMPAGQTSCLHPCGVGWPSQVTPQADRQGPQGRALRERSTLGTQGTQGKLPTAAVRARPMPSPRRKCLVASTRSAHQTAYCSRSRAGSLFPRTPRPPSPPPSHTCLTSHQATASVCTLFQWPSPARCTLILAAIDCGPAVFPASFLSLLVAPLCHMSKTWRTCLSLRACLLG